VKPREEFQDLGCTIRPSWKAMDLPWYGVSNEPCTERALTVSYIPEGWPQAEEGWVETSRSPVRRIGYQSVRYTLPDGREALLTIEGVPHPSPITPRTIMPPTAGATRKVRPKVPPTTT